MIEDIRKVEARSFYGPLDGITRNPEEKFIRARAREAVKIRAQGGTLKPKESSRIIAVVAGYMQASLGIDVSGRLIGKENIFYSDTETFLNQKGAEKTRGYNTHLGNIVIREDPNQAEEDHTGVIQHEVFHSGSTHKVRLDGVSPVTILTGYRTRDDKFFGFHESIIEMSNVDAIASRWGDDPQLKQIDTSSYSLPYVRSVILTDEIIKKTAIHQHTSYETIFRGIQTGQVVGHMGTALRAVHDEVGTTGMKAIAAIDETDNVVKVANALGINMGKKINRLRDGGDVIIMDDVADITLRVTNKLMPAQDNPSGRRSSIPRAYIVK